MTYSLLEILGLRGFATQQALSLAIPDGNAEGSGLTTLVGPNNGGKSTVIEAIRALASRHAHSFTEGRRNKTAGDRVKLALTSSEGAKKILETGSAGGSETRIRQEAIQQGGRYDYGNIFVLPSRRQFGAHFSKNELNRDNFQDSDTSPTARHATDERFAYRLFDTQKHRAIFDVLLSEIISPPPDWSIDQTDTGQYYLKFKSADLTHTSEGMGEGLVSLLLMVAALYDSAPGSMIVIDEPELSLHPALQKKLAGVLRRYAKDRQIVCSTHSPYFVDFEAISRGGKVARVHTETSGSIISELSEDSRAAIKKFTNNLNNPHILGLDAREVFFLEDRVILVEGQDDAVTYPRIAKQLGIALKGDFYGWGVGGADNMGIFAGILSDLGFKKVFGILDSDRRDLAKTLQEKFPAFEFLAIDAKDVRSKPASEARAQVDGLADSSGRLREEFAEHARQVLTKVNAFLEKRAPAR